LCRLDGPECERGIQMRRPRVATHRLSRIEQFFTNPRRVSGNDLRGLACSMHSRGTLTRRRSAESHALDESTRTCSIASEARRGRSRRLTNPTRARSPSTRDCTSSA